MQKLSLALHNGPGDVGTDNERFDLVNGLDEEMPPITEIPDAENKTDSNSNVTRRDKGRPLSLDLDDSVVGVNEGNRVDALVNEEMRKPRPRSLNFDSLRDTEVLPLS